VSARVLAGRRAVVCAYGEVGCASLEALLEVGVEVALVVTHQDAPDETCWFRSVREIARGAGIPTIAPADVNDPSVRSEVAAAAPDFLFSFYFRRMLGRPLLELARRGALNLHGSLLPRYRGRCPVNWVLVRGETRTGVTLHYMDEKPDHGPIVAQHEVEIVRDDTALRLSHKLAAAAHQLLREVVPRLVEGSAPCNPQDHDRATYFGGRTPADGEIDWTQSAEQVRNLVRAVTAPWPGAFSRLGGRKLMVWWAETGPAAAARAPGDLWIDATHAPWVATGDGAVELSRVGWEGDPALPGRSWVRREAVCGGERFERDPAPGRVDRRWA
jgi:UDP-4-amino-4-deoxy-L-arabinose formyltransferase/UDP-glucuronic acid dehydrogenase (UDP-4-keto-hexauronic acid decarboxylating)